MQTNPTKNAALRSIVISLIVRTLSLLILRTVSTHSANKTEREREREFFFSFLFFCFLVYVCERERVCVFSRKMEQNINRRIRICLGFRFLDL